MCHADAGTRRRALVLAAVGAALALRALELRLPAMTRPFWEDEVHHNDSILGSRSLLDLREHVGPQNQPLLEYALRKLVWFRLFGHQERALRLPNLVASVCTPLAAFLLAFRLLERAGEPPLAALLGASLAGLWLTGQPAEVYLGAEARHYSLVSLFSVLWCSLLVFGGGVGRLPFLAASLAFANTHFFAVPLGLAGLGLRALSASRPRHLQVAIWCAVDMLALVFLTRAVNAPAWFWLTHLTPGGHSLRLAEGMTGGLMVWRDYGAYLGFPVAAAVLWLGLAATGVRDRAARTTAFLGLIFLPACFVAMRMRSTYPFGDRYFTPFLGLGFVTLLLAFRHGRAAALRISRGALNGRAAAGLATVALLAGFGAPGHLAALVPDALALRPVPRNFSPYFRIAGELKARGAPLLVIHNHCWADDIYRMYLTRIGRPFRGDFTVTDSLDCLTPGPQVRELLGRTLADSPRTLIILADLERAWPTGPTRPRGPWRASVRRVDEPVSAWIIRGARDVSEVRQIARAVGYTSIEHLFIK